MVKFTKQFEAQLVPEWKDAFVDYWQLLVVTCDQVHRRLASSAVKGELYETELLEQFEGVEAAKEFFVLLDLQLNKVNHFYKTKENEFLERGDSLKKQLEILLELKTALKQQHKRGAQAEELCLVVAMSSAATVYQLYWDYVKDWGLHFLFMRWTRKTDHSPLCVQLRSK